MAKTTMIMQPRVNIELSVEEFINHFEMLAVILDLNPFQTTYPDEKESFEKAETVFKVVSEDGALVLKACAVYNTCIGNVIEFSFVDTDEDYTAGLHSLAITYKKYVEILESLDEDEVI